MAKKRNNRGSFFVLDGPDGSGKTTQVALLQKALQRMGRKVMVVDFPQYEKTLFGAMVGKYLKGEYGDVFKISPYLSSLVYALDRWSAAKKIRTALHKGHIVLANRFTSSNIIHQGAKFIKVKERHAYFSWLDEMEFSVLQIPRPTKVIFLDVPSDISWKLIETRNRKTHPQGSSRDAHEANRKHLHQAYGIAKQFALNNRGWGIVSCVTGRTLLSKEEVHNRVLRFILRYI